MSRHIIDFAAPESAYDRKPWPVGLDENNVVTSGLGSDDSALLVGFGPTGEQRVTVYAAEAMDHPERVVGLSPTFSKDGKFFSWAPKVRELVTFVPSTDPQY